MPALDLRAWASVSNEALRQILHRINRPQPSHFTPLLLAGQRIGWLAPGHVQPLCKHLAYCKNHGQAVVWEAADLSVQARSQLLAEAAQKLREQAHIHGWRDELYSYWGEIDRDPDPQLPECFRLERSVFRFLGLRSHAVHINGFRPDGRIWCGIRALSKATDPGRIDNLAAGGLPAGETVMACAIRELHEELGIETWQSCLAPLTFASHAYADFHLLMPLFACRKWQGIVQSREGQALAWVRPERLRDYPMPPADLPLIPILRDWL